MLGARIEQERAQKMKKKNSLVNKVWESYGPLQLTDFEKKQLEKSAFLGSYENIFAYENEIKRRKSS